MFEPRFGELTPTGVLSALGHAFFTLSIGMGAVMAYGAYVPDKVSISATSVTVVCMDTGIALITGLVIFPIVFRKWTGSGGRSGSDLRHAAAGLRQHSGWNDRRHDFFPVAHVRRLDIGHFADRTRGGVGDREPRRLAPRRHHRYRRRNLGAWPAQRVFLQRDGRRRLHMWGTYFDSADFLTSNIMLPAGGFAIAVFAGWVMSRRSSAGELRLANPAAYRLWRFASRFVAPIGGRPHLSERRRRTLLARNGRLRSVRRQHRVPYTPEQMFDLVNDVDAYPDFLHWCRSSSVETNQRYRSRCHPGGRHRRHTQKLHHEEQADTARRNHHGTGCGSVRRIQRQLGILPCDADGGCTVELHLAFEVSTAPSGNAVCLDIRRNGAHPGRGLRESCARYLLKCGR